MTGREFIIYILNNHLEDEEVFKDGTLVGFETASEAAVRLGMGVATLHAIYAIGQIDGFEIGDRLFIPANAEPKKRGAYEKNI